MTTYPVSVSVVSSTAERNRLTVAFRLILAIPHFILVGGVGLSFVWPSGDNSIWSVAGHDGILGAIAIALAVVSWFTIVLAGEHITAIRQFTVFIMRWRTRAVAYAMLLVDPYPPFGDAAYPASFEVVEPAGPRRRLGVAFRLFLAIPQLVVLVLVMLAWWITAIIAWCAIVVTGRYPAGLYTFGVGALRWLMRVEAYMLLLVDEYPPFSLE
jgi:Domain of unknown function (DUF4389)